MKKIILTLVVALLFASASAAVSGEAEPMEISHSSNGESYNASFKILNVTQGELMGEQVRTVETAKPHTDEARI